MKREFIFVLLGAAFLGISGTASAQQDQVGLKLDVDQRQVEVGDKLTVTIEFKQVGSAASAIQGPSIATPEHFQIGGTSSATQVTMVGQQTAEVSTTRLSLTATTPGEEAIGPAVLIYQDPQLGRRELKSNVARVTVVEKSKFSLFGHKKAANPPPTPPPAAANPAPNPGDQIRDIKPLFFESLSALLLRILVWLAVFGVFLVVIWRFFIRKKPAGPKPALTEEARLREAWRKLGNEDLGGEEFCLALSSLVRECLQYRFGFPAVDYTTEEILKAVTKNKLTDDEKVAAEKCLKACDKVLYADGNLGSKDNLRTLCSALLPKIRKNS